MSAYLVDRDHIRYLVAAAMSRRILGSYGPLRWYWRDPADPGNPAMLSGELRDGDNARAAQVGQMLWSENLRSVTGRYPDCPLGELPGPVDDVPVYDTHEPLYGDACGGFEPVQVLKSIGCLRYQSCEHDEWEASEAHAFLAALEQSAIHRLTGYDEAKWGAPDIRPSRMWRII